MKKNWVTYSLSLISIMLMSATCTNDEENEKLFESGNSNMTLTMNGKLIKSYYGPSGEWDGRLYGEFSFWVNDLTTIAYNDGVYIQAKINDNDSDEGFDLEAGEDVTQRLFFSLNYKHGDGYVVMGWTGDDDYRSGTLKIQALDKKKHIIVLKFNNMTFDSTNDDDTSINKIVLNGTLTINYKVISE